MGGKEVKREEKLESNRFSINIESLVNKKKEIFTFSGPEIAPLGLIYDAAHRVLTEVSNIIKEKTDDYVNSEKKKNTNVGSTDTQNNNEVVKK